MRTQNVPFHRIPFKLGFYIFLWVVFPLIPTVVAEDQYKITVQGEQLIYEGKPFRVQGVEYSPWEPGTGPGRGHWPSPEKMLEDLEMIQELGCNVVSVVDPPKEFFAVVEKTPLFVIYTMGIFQSQWENFGSEDFQAKEKRFLQDFSRYKDNPKIFLWVMGREITPAAQQKRGNEIVQWMKATTETLRAQNPETLISHANWPPTRALNLDFLDVACFDLYPGWPPEVSLRGFGKYITDVLQPIASGRPLLITEFGINSVEVTLEEQGEILRKCWLELLQAKACGAVVFSFMDEWWKNYDNPISVNSWWARKPAPNDAATHDLDPEEHYGLVRADRTPKPAYYIVREMFGQSPLPVVEKKRLHIIIGLGAGFILLLLMIKVGSVILSRKSARPTNEEHNSPPHPESKNSSSAGFTLIELLIVIAVIALLLALLVPTLHRSKEQAKKVSCLSNLQQIYLSMSYYAHDNRGKIPTRLEKSGNKIWGNWLGSEWNPYGLGHLIKGKYVSEPRIFYCPSNQMVKFKEQYWFHIKGSTSWMTYRYRNNNNAGHPAHWGDIYLPTRIEEDQKAIVADDPYLDWQKSAHLTGYNVLYLDSHAHWVDDPEDTIEGDLYKAWELFDNKF